MIMWYGIKTTVLFNGTKRIVQKWKICFGIINKWWMFLYVQYVQWMFSSVKRKYSSRVVGWKITSFTSWKYFYHCTHKHPLFVYAVTTIYRWPIACKCSNYFAKFSWLTRTDKQKMYFAIFFFRGKCTQNELAY
jgi:hypothetical protein